MKHFFLTILLLNLLLTTGKAQYFPVDTAKLNKAYMTLKQGICTEKTEMDFMEAFPTTWLEFYMTYSYINDENYDISMSQICSEHLITLLGLSHVNDTLLCKKVVNLTIGMKDNGECTSVYQDYLIGYIFKNEDLIINTLSKLKKGIKWNFGNSVGLVHVNVIEPNILTKYTTETRINTLKKWKYHALLTNISTRA